MKRFAIIALWVVMVLALTAGYKPTLGDGGSMANYRGSMARSPASMSQPETITLAFNPGFGTLYNPTALTPDSTYVCSNTEFRAMNVYAAVPDSVGAADDYDYWRLYMRSTSSVEAFPLAAQGVAGLHYPLEQIPDNVLIEEAYLTFRCDGNPAIFDASGDGFYAILDTTSTDRAWVTAGVAPRSSTNDRISDTSWNEADRVADTAWVPALADRTEFWDWGIPSKVAHNGEDIAPGDAITIDVTEVLQYWVDFHVVRDIDHAGFLIAASDGTSSSIYIPCGTGASANVSPSLIVKYTTSTRKSWPWSGSPTVFAFTTDDAQDTNLDYMPLFESRGMRYTMFVSGNYIDGYDNDDDSYLTASQIDSIYDVGVVEIASHGRAHRSMATIPTDPDTLYREYSTKWLVDDILGEWPDSTVVSTFAYAHGDTSTAGIDYIKSLGYRGARLAADQFWGITPTFKWDAAGDYSGVYTVQKYTWSNWGAGDAEYAVIAENVYDAIGRSWLRDHEPIVTLSHSTSEITVSTATHILDYLASRKDVRVSTFGALVEDYRAVIDSN